MMRPIYLAGICWAIWRGDLLGLLLFGLALDELERRRRRP